MSGPSTNGQSAWTWSPAHSRYYRHEWNVTTQKWELIWGPEPTHNVLSSTAPARSDSATGFRSPYQSLGLHSSAPASPFQVQGQSQTQREVGSYQSITYNSPPHERHYRRDIADSGHYERLDPAFRVRRKDFFTPGRVLAVVFSEPAGSVTKPNVHSTNFSIVKNADYAVHTQIRRFVVVRQKREFCFACPIFTYGGRATTKHGVRPEEHAIIYSSGHEPELLAEETGITMASIGVVMSPREPTLDRSCRIYLGIHHPIQYNVKVKDVGMVLSDHIPTLLNQWRSINDPASVSEESSEATHSTRLTPSEGTRSGQIFEPKNGKNYPEADDVQSLTSILSLSHIQPTTPQSGLQASPPDENYGFENVKNPKRFFSKGRVFITNWTEPAGGSGHIFSEAARFVVVKNYSTYAVCLRISTYSGQATTKPGVYAPHYAAVIPKGGQIISHPDGENMTRAIEVDIENPTITIDPMSRINFAKPYTVEHNITVRNVGKVVGDSIGLLALEI